MPEDESPETVKANQALDRLSQAFEAQMELSREQMAITNALRESQVEVSEAQERIAQERWNYYQRVYLPQEEQYARETMAGLDPEQYRRRAALDVQRATERAKEIYKRDLSRYGLDPESGRYQGVMSDFDLARAAQEAGAGTASRFGVAELNRARQYQMAAFGKGIPSEASTMLAGAGRGYAGAGQAIGSGYRQAATPLVQYGAALGARADQAYGQLAALQKQDWQFETDARVALSQGLGSMGSSLMGAAGGGGGGGGSTMSGGGNIANYAG